MAKYYYQIDATDYGPVSFPELIALVNSGDIESSTPVRLDDSNKWLAAEEIPGLFRQAENTRRKKSAEKPSDASGATASRNPNAKGPGAESHSTSTQKGHGAASSTELAEHSATKSALSRPLMAIVAIVILMTATGGFMMWSRRNARFPQPVVSTIQAGTELSLEQMKASAPAQPSLDIPVGKAMLVPGLEAETGTSSPALSADLLKIVYLKPVVTQDDLYLAERSSKDQPFGKPVRLNCSTPAHEQFCSLSPDGKYLLFTSQGSPSILQVASSDDGFRTSKPVQFDGLDLTLDNIDNGEWLTQNKIKFAAGDSKYTRRQQYVAEFDADSGIARNVTTISLQNSWPRIHFSSDLKRGYFANQTGILITAPKVAMTEFSMGLVLFDTTVIGPVDEALDDPIFVVPQEDVIFYAGTGPSTDSIKDARRNKVWMIRM